MSKGDGSIIQLGRNKWRVMIPLGTNPITGKRERVSKVVNGSKAKARKVRDQMNRDHENKLTTDAETITFVQYAEQWRQSCETAGGIGTCTLKENEHVVKVFSGYMKDIKLKDVTPSVIESLYTQMKQDHNYSGTTMHKYHVKLKQILRHAVDHDVILRNPCDRVTAPKKDEVERPALTQEEATRLLKCIDEYEETKYDILKADESCICPWRDNRGNGSQAHIIYYGLRDLSNVMAIRIGLATGMRIGEIMALVWDDIDLAKGKIHVRHNLTNYGEVKSPKSKAGVRTISLDFKTRVHLITWKTEQMHYLNKIEVFQDAQTPVCCSDIGGYNQVNNFEHWWKGWRKDQGFKDLKFHSLRHTQATECLSNGVDVKTVQTRLGHANASLTLNTYAHAIPENDEKAAELIGSLHADKEEPKIIEIKTA